MEHQLVIEYQSGHYEAHCSCGHWAAPGCNLSADRLWVIYPQFEEAHHRHIVQAGRADAERLDLTGAGEAAP